MNLMKSLLLCLLMTTLGWSPAPAQSGGASQEPVEWYLDEVIDEVFVGRNDFEYYYLPSAAEMAQHRQKGEVHYFLNTPSGLTRKKACDMIDRIMATYDDIKPRGEWHQTSTTFWKEFQHQKNRFRFSVKRKALDDGTYYVSVTESANYYRSLGKANSHKQADADLQDKRSTRAHRRAAHRDRKAVIVDDDNNDVDSIGDTAPMPVVSDKQRRQEAREKKEAQRQEERLRQRREQEKRREQAREQKEAEKQKKAEQKKQKEEEKRLKKEEEQRQRQQARKMRDQERRDKEAARQQAAQPKAVESRYHYSDVALWLSEKYDFTQVAADEASCTMFSTAVKDIEMAKLAIKNALKGSNARMAVPWRLNADTQAVETGYTVDGHILVFAIGKDSEGNITLTVTEVSNEQFQQMK